MNDIEILEKFIKIKINSYAMQFVDIPYPRLQEAIENLINRVKELEEIEEDHRKENGKLRQENHSLKEQLQMFIPRRRVRRVYKMLGKILKQDGIIDDLEELLEE